MIRAEGLNRWEKRIQMERSGEEEARRKKREGGRGDEYGVRRPDNSTYERKGKESARREEEKMKGEERCPNNRGGRKG